MTLSLRQLRSAFAPLREAAPTETVTFEMGGVPFTIKLAMPNSDQETWAVNFAREVFDEGGSELSASQDATKRYQRAVLSQVILSINGQELTEDYVELEEEVSPGVRKKIPMREALYEELTPLPGTLLTSLFSRFNIMVQLASAEIAKGINYPKEEARQKAKRLRDLADAIDEAYKEPVTEEPEPAKAGDPKSAEEPEPVRTVAASPEKAPSEAPAVEEAPVAVPPPVTPVAAPPSRPFYVTAEGPEDLPLRGPDPIDVPMETVPPPVASLNPAARPRPAGK